ncbi:MAG: hypothetical protein R6U86_09695 [Bacteroidales bacterium]
MRVFASLCIHPLSVQPAWIVLLVIGLQFVLPGCQQMETGNEDLLAKVYDNRLYLSDIESVVPPGASSNDSAIIVKRYVDNWVRQQVFLHHASANMDLDALDFEKKILDYKNSLLIFAYETQLVQNHMDTLITEEQIREYYEENNNSFRLQENIVKVAYVKVPLDAPEINVLRRLFRSDDPDDLVLLEDYCVQHAASYLTDTDNWLVFSDLLRELPVQADNPEAFLRANRMVEVSDDYYRYFLNIQDYKLKGSVSPLSFERDNVRRILLNRRKHAFVNQQREEMFQNALNDGRLETYF